MAWLARSIANTLKLDEEDEDDDKKRIGEDSGSNLQSPSVSDSQSPRGVKEDITELTKTLRSQFWGVASFISKPSSSPDLHERNQSSDHVDKGEDEDLIAGIRNDFAEIGGRFRTGISKLSGNLPVSEFTKIASNFLQLSSEGVDLKDYEAIGVTEELVAFVRDLVMRPEIWLDFPLPDDEDNFDDFEMTDAQHEHALAMERLAPSLSSLRIELCPEYMSEDCFWRIYFVLVHPKLDEDKALLLSTSQVLEAKAMLSQELQKTNKTSPNAESSEANAVIVEPLDVPHNPSMVSATVTTVNPIKSSNIETDKHPIESKEIEVVDKSVIEERNTSTASSSTRINVQVEEEEDDADDWLKDDETSESVSDIKGRATTSNPLCDDEEDVSFSDLEEDEGDVKVSYKKVSDSSDKTSPDWS